MIAITGLMRSGTSPLAMFAHQMGVTMGTYLRFPIQGDSGDFEWEDAALADPLVAEIAEPNDLDRPHRIIDDYVKHRKRVANGKPWGVKTPFLLPFLDHLKSACEEIDEPLVLVLTDRPYADTVRSLRRGMDHLSEYERGGVMPVVFGIQDSISRHWLDASKDAEVFHFSDTIGYPRMAAERLAKLAGVDADLDVAIRGFRGRGL